MSAPVPAVNVPLNKVGEMRPWVCVCVDQVVPGLTASGRVGDSPHATLPCAQGHQSAELASAEHLRPSEYAQGCGDCLEHEAV